MKHRLLLSAFVLLLSGCVRFHAKLQDTSVTLEGEERTITTELSGMAWFSSAQSLSKIKATSTDKTQSFGVDGMNQTGPSNTVATINALRGLVESVGLLAR